MNTTPSEPRFFWCPRCRAYTACADPEGRAEVYCGTAGCGWEGTRAEAQHPERRLRDERDRAIARAESAERERDGLAAVAAELLAALEPFAQWADRLGDDRGPSVREIREARRMAQWADRLGDDRGPSVREIREARRVYDRPLPAAVERVRKLAEAVEVWRVADAADTRAWMAMRNVEEGDEDGHAVAAVMLNEARTRLDDAEEALRTLAESALPPTAGTENKDA